MTDDYGTEKDQADQAGTWQADRPHEMPPDDFADPQSSGEEAAMVSQEAEAEAVDASTASGKNSRSILPMAAAVVGLLFLGAAVYWQFGRSVQPPVPPMVMIAQTQATPKTAPTPVPAASTGAEAAATQNAGTSDLKGLYKTAPESANTETTPKTAMATIPEAPAPASGSASPTSTAAAPNSPPLSPPSPSSSSSATSSPSSFSSAAPVTSAAAAAPSSAGSVDPRLAILTTRVDDLQKSLDQANKRLNQIGNMAAANQAVPTSGGHAVPALEERLNKIEQTLLEIQSKQAAGPEPSKPTTVVAEVTSPMPVVPAKHESVKKDKKPAVQHAAQHKTAPKKSKKTAVSKAKAPAEIPAATPHWVLRAATPDEAWVSINTTSPDLRHLQVGDILPGIGRVRAIRQTGGNWVIDGANGNISSAKP